MKCAGIKHPGAWFLFHAFSLARYIYNLANHNKVPPLKLLLGKPNLDFSIQLVARKIDVKNRKIFKTGRQPAQ